MRLIGIGIWVALSCYVGEAGTSWIPLRMAGGFALTDGVFINGAGPYTFLIDTGGQSSTISPELARRLRLQPSYAVMHVTAVAERAAPAHVVSNLTLGPAGLDDVEVIESAMEAVRRAAGPVDGILGQNFLGRFAWLLDWNRKVLRFDLDRTLSARHSGRRTEVDRSHGRLRVPVRIGTDIFGLVLDSGASHLILFERPAALTKERESRIESATGGRAVIAGTLRRVSVGGVDIDEVPAAIARILGQSEKGLLPVNLFRAVYADAEAGFVVFNP